MPIKRTAKAETVNIRTEVAAAVAEAAVAAAKVLATTNLESRVTLLENKLVQIELDVKRGNVVADEILEIVKLGKAVSRIFQWIVGVGAAIGTMAIAWHWYK